MRRSDLLLADKTQATLFTPDPYEYNHALNLHINGTRIKTTKRPTILGLTFDPKLKFHEHIKNTEKKANGTIKCIKALSGTNWGQQKETLVNTYKQYTRPIMEYACPAWAPIVSKSNIQKLQRVQNAALRCSTGHTKDTNNNHYHQETKVLPVETHIKMLTSQYRENMRDPSHPLHNTLTDPKPDRKMKNTAQDTDYSLVVHSCDSETDVEKDRKRNRSTIHTEIVKEHLENIGINALLERTAPNVHGSELELPRAMRRTLAQLRAQKCPLLRKYLHSIGAAEDACCPLCWRSEHNTAHLFECKEIVTQLAPKDLWEQPVLAAELVGKWQIRLENLDA